MPTSIATKNYTLDKAKSLEKKANSCAKEHMKYVLTPGNNLVIEFSTAAYELSKQCLYDLLYSKDFEYVVEKRNNIDLDGANVDTCYKVFNKKADGSCGKLQKFVINSYHTTSQILINGSKIDIFIDSILDKLCAEMKERCSQLTIMNMNIASALNKSEQELLPAIKDKKDSNKDVTNSLINEHEPGNEPSDNEVCEMCPMCGQQAYGKVVQCGECVDLYYYDCLNINDNAIDTLGDEDFVCHSCTNELLYAGADTNGANNEHSSLEDTQVDNTQKPQHSGTTSKKPIIIQEDESQTLNPKPQNEPLSEPTQNIKDHTHNEPPKSKPKKVTKNPSMKIKKEDIIDKSYVLELENQISTLKSTIDLYKKTVTHSEIENSSKTSNKSDPPNSKENEKGCRHSCCEELKDKIQDNRMRMLEMQMIQNMHINNSMHMQLISQIGTVNNRAQPPVMPGYTNYLGQREGFHGPGQSNIYGGPTINQTPIYQTPIHRGYGYQISGTQIPNHQIHGMQISGQQIPSMQIPNHLMPGPHMPVNRMSEYQIPGYPLGFPLGHQQPATYPNAPYVRQEPDVRNQQYPSHPTQNPVRFPVFPTQHSGQQSTSMQGISHMSTTHPRSSDKGQHDVSHRQPGTTSVQTSKEHRGFRTENATKSNAASKSSSPTPVIDSESQYGLNSKYVSPTGNQSRKRHISNNSQKKTDVSPEHGKRHCEMLESVHEKQSKTNTETHSVDRPPIKATGNSDDPINVDNLSQINLNTNNSEGENRDINAKSFLEIPAMKHDPPEPIEACQPLDQRD